MVIRFNQCFHGCLHYRIQKVISEHFFLRDATNVSSKQCHFAPFIKVTCNFLHFPPKNATFFRPKKGPRTGLSHSLTHLTAIQFSDHAKSMAQITERIFNEHAPDAARKNQLFS